MDGSFVYRKASSGGKIYKVPTTPKEAMKSGLLGMTEKARMAQFTAWIDSVNLDDRKTWVSKGLTGSTKLDLDKMPGARRGALAPAHAPACLASHVVALARQARSSSNSGSSRRARSSSSRTRALSTATTASTSGRRWRSWRA